MAGGYAFRAGQALPPLLLDDEEALAVAIARQIAAAGTVSGVEESSLRALVKLAQVMPARLCRRTDALRSAILPLQRMGPTVDANVLATLAAACRDQLQVGFAYRDVHKPIDVMSPRIPPAAARLEPIDESRCLVRCPAHQLDWLVYWLMSLDVEFEVLGPPALKQRLRSAGERLARAVAASA